MKGLPTVIASVKRNLSIELTEFEGDVPIPNRDATALGFRVRLGPATERSRVAVLFSRTAMAIRPEALGLPRIEDRQTRLVVFAEAALGDFLDESGLPEYTPSGVGAFTVDCFTPRFQAWSERAVATDEAVEEYLAAHVYHAWNFDLQSWQLGLPDLIRLRQTLEHILRIAELYERDRWAVGEKSDAGFTLTPTALYLRQVREKVPLARRALHNEKIRSPDQSTPSFPYVDESRIADLRALDHQTFDVSRLIAICEELNLCFRAQCYHAVAALNRALLDHVPPIFDCQSFSSVANQHTGATKSFRDCMLKLEAARTIGDKHLHTMIRAQEALPTSVQVDFSQLIDTLLEEVVRVLRSTPPPKAES